MKVFVDSSVWIDHFRQRPTPAVMTLRGLEAPEEIVVGDVVLLEILRGARDDAQSARLQRVLSAFSYRSMMTAALTVEAAARYRTLRALGITIRKLPDLIIATYCLREDIPLLQQDRDFLPFAEHFGLRLL